MQRTKPEISDLHLALQLLSKKLTDEEYTLVAGAMFQLFMGERFGYLNSMDGRLLDDIKLIHKYNKHKKIKQKAQILKFKVIKGGKK